MSVYILIGFLPFVSIFQDSVSGVTRRLFVYILVQVWVCSIILMLVSFLTTAQRASFNLYISVGLKLYWIGTPMKYLIVRPVIQIESKVDFDLSLLSLNFL